MGLLGGFKAKFKAAGNREKKQKSSKADKNTVVCVKFNTFSEFDSQPVEYAASTSRQNIGKNEVVRERKSISKPPAQSLFEQPNQRNGSVVNIAEHEDKPIEFKKVTPKSHDDKKSNKKEAPKPKEHKITTPVPAKREIILNDIEIDETPTSTIPDLTNKIVQLPSSSQINESSDEVNSEPVYATASGYGGDDDEGNFKIHFVNHASLVDTESSSDEDIDDVKLEPVNLNYSSQAASIFFGSEDDEEPVVIRPRSEKFLMNDDDTASDSSADC